MSASGPSGPLVAYVISTKFLHAGSCVSVATLSLYFVYCRRYIQVGGNPLIFIISDSTRGESNERLLFPKDIQQQLAVQNIR